MAEGFAVARCDCGRLVYCPVREGETTRTLCFGCFAVITAKYEEEEEDCGEDDGPADNGDSN